MYRLFVFQTIAPLMAQSMPVSVSPTFMLETSMATTGVASKSGFRGIGSIVKWLWFPKVGATSSIEGGLRVVSFGWKYVSSMFFMDLRLSSRNFCGSCRSSRVCGKLYLGVVV